MKPLGLGEHGGLTIVREGRAFVAYLRYRCRQLSDLSSEQEHEHDELQGHQQCSNPVVLQPCARI